VPGFDLRYVRQFGLAFDFIGTLLGAAVLGWWLDRELGSGPWLFLACMVVAVMGGSVRLAQKLKYFERMDRGSKP
jgi:F0F1-type ATP synthase assembly protein I